MVTIIKTGKNSVTISDIKCSHDGDMITAIMLSNRNGCVEVNGIMPLLVGNDSPLIPFGWVDAKSFELPADITVGVKREIVIAAHKLMGGGYVLMDTNYIITQYLGSDEVVFAEGMQ